MRKISKNPKLMIVLFTMVILLFIGVSYGSWSNILSLGGAFTTGNFHIEYGNKEDVELSLVTLNSKDNITVHHNITNVNVTKNDDQSMVVAINDNLINKMKESDYLLQIKYPIKATNNSKIKAIQPRPADFKNPDSNITLTPDTISIDMDIPVDINERDYIINANIYKQIEEDNTGTVFLEITDINNSYDRIGSIDYDFIAGSFSPEELYDNPTIDVQIEAEYSLEISIETEQFNNVEGVKKYGK